MPAFDFPDSRTFFRQISQVARCGCRRCSGDLAVLAGAEPALETFGAFLEHSQQCFLLPFIELPTQPVEQLRFVD